MGNSIKENELFSKLGKSKDIMNMVENKNIKHNPNMDDERIGKIRGSKLPDEIKNLMISHPIEQVNLNDGIGLTGGLNENIMKNARRLMENDVPKPKGSTLQQTVNNLRNNNELLEAIEHIVRKVLDEKLGETDSGGFTNINESLALKVGSSLFKGKITSVTSTKK